MASLDNLPKTFKAISISGPNQPWEVKELPLQQPGSNQVLVRVHACGICASDRWVKEGTWPGLQYPRIPGHEIVGRVAALGEGIVAMQKDDEARGLVQPGNARFQLGGLVGVGWNGGYCGSCVSCRDGEYWMCLKGDVTGFTFDGGVAEYVAVPYNALVSIPESALDNADYAELAPLNCGGVSVYDAIRTSKWKPGDLCVVQGIGGLGHLAVQYAAKMGLTVYAVSSGSSKRDLALSLGAKEYIDSSASDAVAQIQALGGAKLILCTAPYAKVITGILPALAKNGTVTMVSAAMDGEVHVGNVWLNMHRACVRGWCCGASADSEQALKFSTNVGIKSVVAKFALEEYAKAYESVMDNKARLRNVIVFP